MATSRQKIIRLGLIALLIVSLSALLLLLMGDRSGHASNTRTISQIQEYMKALELIRANDGRYPGPSEFVCLGDYPDDGCWNRSGMGKFEHAELNAQLAEYLPLLPAGRLVKDSLLPGLGREGYIYRQFNNGNNYEIRYVLQGHENDCGLGKEVVFEIDIYGENVLCHIVR